MVKKPRFHAAAIATLLLTGVSAGADEINVYSARQEALIKPLLKQFSDHTGVRVNLVTGKADALLTRLELEGEKSPADVLVTIDAGRLHRAKTAGLLHKVSSDLLRNTIPDNYRDPDGYWYGLSSRARIIMATAGIDTKTVNSYEALAAPSLRGKICIRSSGNIYNQSLVASMIAAHGSRAALEWTRGLVANFARPPTGGDRDQVLAAAGGLCDIAVANTYYLAMMLSGDDARQREAAQAITVVWPNQNGRGAHVNVSGAGVTAAAAKRGDAAEAATKLIEYLVSAPAQHWYAEANNEYPIRPDVEISGTLQKWGAFKHDPLRLEKLGELNAEAVKLMDKAGWE